MSTVQSIAIERAVALLKASGAQFAIVAADGTKFGALEVAPPKPLRRPIKNPGIGEYIDKFVDDMPPGASVVIPLGGFSKADLQKSASSRCCAKWGSGNVITHRNDVGVEVLRVS